MQLVKDVLFYERKVQEFQDSLYPTNEVFRNMEPD